MTQVPLERPESLDFLAQQTHEHTKAWIESDNNDLAEKAEKGRKLIAEKDYIIEQFKIQLDDLENILKYYRQLPTQEVYN